MLLQTRIFELCNGKYNNLTELAKVMGISVSQIYRVRQGKRSINQKFLLGALKAFPKYKFDDLFYLTPDMPTVTNIRHQDALITHSQISRQRKRNKGQNAPRNR